MVKNMAEKDLDTKLDSATWSEVLVQALPYIKQWVGKVVVVKYGGNAMLNEDSFPTRSSM